ncbi:MAG TPA: hypothetical protein VNV66_08840 [Pilimelia sp.]|nr:hypothetical protein [Pilimelia sp.]
MTGDDPDGSVRTERRALFAWVLIVATGLIVTWLAGRADAVLGTDAPPFLGAYRWHLTPAGLLAPAVAAAVLAAAHRGWFERLRWPAVLAAGYAAALAWAVALALADGAAGLTEPLATAQGPVGRAAGIGADPAGFLRDADEGPAPAPGPALVVWGLGRLGLDAGPGLAVALLALAALAVPLVLATVRNVCGELPARRYLPVLALAPYAVWLAAGAGAGLTAVLGAAAAAAGAWASDHRRTGRRSATGAVLAGVLLGAAALCSYAAPWLGLAIGGLYFARRRAALNLLSAAGALVPLAGVHVLGFRWADGLRAAQAHAAARSEPPPSWLWWVLLGLVALLVVAGPALAASLPKVRHTPGWPLLVGAGAAVVFTLLAGLARGGAEQAWPAFLPWLTLAAVAPESRRHGPPAPAPLLLAGAGAAAAVLLRAVLEVRPWPT